MKTYLISYDLSRAASPFEYKKLGEKIRSYGYWAKPLESVWIIRTTLTAGQVLEDVRPTLHTPDKLLVVELTSHWATLNVATNVTDWMKKAVI